MANYHDDELVIAANETDMLNVLRAIAFNLSTQSDETNYFDPLLDESDIVSAFKKVGPVIGGCYMFAFTSGPIGSDQQAEALENEGDHSDSGFEGVRAYLTSLKDAGFNVRANVAPSGRGMSETASVSFDRYGSIYVLRIGYSTAWEPNTEDVDCLFHMLPKGQYGVAFVDGDEYDDYESLHVTNGLHSGRARMSSARPSDSGINGNVMATELFDYAKANSDVDLSREGDLARIAAVCAALGWNDYPEESEPTASTSSDCESISWYSYDSENGGYHEPCLPWGSPTVLELAAIDKHILAFLEKFPFECEVTGQRYQGRNANLDFIVPEAAVVLQSDWNSPYFRYAGIEIFDTSGRSLANVGGYYNPTNDDRISIACLLPHIMATAVDVTPGCAIPSEHKQIGQFTIHLEIEPIDVQNVIGEINDLLHQNNDQRARRSIEGKGC